MKSRLFSLLLTGMMLLSGVSAWANIQQNEDGAYLIGSKADLLEWTQIEGYEATNVVLTGDILDLDFILCPDTVLRSIDSYNGPAYTGVFDGAGHTITINYDIPGQRVGIFGGLDGTVKNLIVDGKMVATYKNCAGLALWTTGNGRARFENVLSKIVIDVDWTGNTSNAGFVGYAAASCTFENCLSAIKVSGNQKFNHGFVGWCASGPIMNYINCISICEVETANTFSWGNPKERASHINCYSYNQDNDPASPLKGSTYIENRDLLTSGELCYKLNGDQSNIQWYQTLGEDSYPIPLKGHSQVYAIGDIRCDGVALGEISYSNSNDAPIPQHQYNGGFCTVCNKIQVDYKTPNADGYYELGSATDVEWFAAMVNDEHQTTINGILTADIDYQGVENAHKAIGANSTYKYNGIFDGQGHVIKNMIMNYPTETFIGFFGFVRGGTVIRNLVIDESCEVTADKCAAGLVGAVQTPTDTPFIIDNCANHAKITALTGAAAGIIGAGQSGYSPIQVSNCLNTGEISGTPATAFCSWNNKGGSSFTNCVNTGSLTGVDMAGNKYSYYCTLFRVEPGTTTITNCFDFSDFDDEGAGHQGTEGDWQTEDPLANGELCYLLNGTQKTINWYQRIGTDANPVPYYIENGIVYAQGQINCDGTPISLSGFSNNKGDVIPSHEYEDGFCVNCGVSQDDYVPQEDGFYMISNASQLYWFSRQVNEFKHGNWSAKLTDNIDMEDYTELYSPIGCDATQFRGTFDGQGHVISNLHIDDTSRSYVGLIGRCAGGAVVQNILLDETCSISGGKCVGLVGGTYNAGGTLTLRNLGNMGNVYAVGVQAAGILGANSGSQTTILIENCFSTGSIQGGSESAAIVGWAGSNSPKVYNCWSCSEVSGYTDGKNEYFARHTNGTISNCYCTSEVEQQANVALLNFDEIMTGALCYKLNGDQTNVQWYQNLDNDATQDDQPLPFSNGHAQVYPKGGLLCDGSANPDNTEFTNTANTNIPDHQFKDGFCDVCGQEDPEYTGFLSVIGNPDFTTNASGWSGTGFSASNKVAYQSNKTFDTYQDIKGLEVGVYRLRVQGFSRSGNIENEEIYTDAQLTNDILRNTYFYAESDSLRQARRLMDITAGAQSHKYNDGNGEYELPNGKYIPSSAASAAIYLGKGKYWNEPLYLAVTNDTLPVRIGFVNQFDSKDSWTVIDRIRLEYVGNDADAYALITKQTIDEAIDMEEVEGQETLKDLYKEAIEEAANQTEVADILAAADKASRLPNEIKSTVQAYQEFYAVIDKIYKDWESRDDLSGEAADILESYLTEENEPNETYPNGTYQYIKHNRELSIAQLAAEAKFAEQLLTNAVKTNIAAGSDITKLIVNPDFDSNEADWFGWTTTTGYHESSWNMTYNSGYHDIQTVAGAYNTAFEVAQEIPGLPNGIYVLTANTFHRPGTAKQGNYDGTDVMPAELFLNNYNTPVLSVYADPISYDDAVNGVNCRIDPNEAGTPHAGENTDKRDIDINIGYVADDVYTGSFAFSANRYEQKAYAIVTDGTLRLGIRNNETPWRSKNVTVWGKFRLSYQGQNEDAIKDILNQYSDRVEMLDIQRSTLDYYMSSAHIENIRTNINAAMASSNAEEQIKLIQTINDEFNAIPHSVEMYKKLSEISQYAMDMVDKLEPGDLQDEMIEIYTELGDIIYEGSLTDEQVDAKIQELMGTAALGTIYIQGDLYDENRENGEWPYNEMCMLYPMTKNSDGKYVGTVTLQDRSRRIKGYQRAGVYFRQMNTKFKCADANRNFITPGYNTFGVTDNGGADFQALNGTYDVVLDLENNTVQFTLKDEYNWDNAVYVIGTLASRAGATLRWKNDEQVALQHMGNGFYSGVVTLAYDNSNPYCSFGIITCRSTNQMINGSTATRDNGSESRYGSEEQYLEINSGVQYSDLVRGLDRTWRIATPGKYIIEFDMNNRTMKATLVETKGVGTEQNPYQIATANDMVAMSDYMIKGKTTYFKFVEDIDMKGRKWWPLNSTYMMNSSSEGHTRFVNIDGQNHIVKNLTVVNYNDNAYETGIFGALNGTVKNLGFYNVQVEGGNTVTAGLLAGWLGTEEYVNSSNELMTSTIENCYVTGKLNAQGNAGAIAGTVGSNTLISNCYTNANVVSNAIEGYYQGEMIGQNGGNLKIQNSYAAGKVNGSTVAGLMGEGQSCTQENVLFYDGTNQQNICNTVSQWAAWNEKGDIADGWPILNWQVERKDYMIYSGFGCAKMGDVNGDGTVDGSDIVALVGVVNAAGYDTVYDLDANGTVDGSDIVVLVGLVNNTKTPEVKAAIQAWNSRRK